MLPMVWDRIWLILRFLTLFFTSFLSGMGGQFGLSGKVSDATTGQPLPAANIRILNSSRGTITNSQGSFVLQLDSGAHTLIFSYLGYQPDTLLLTGVDRFVEIRLRPSPIQLPEVLILAEDPAVEIIRRAIEHKRSWMNKLSSYRFDAFTRQVLWRDTAIASIMESFTTGFSRSGDSLREIVRQKRQTQNIPAEANLAAVRRIVNFNEDEVSLFSFRVDGNSTAFTFVGPTAPNALDCYDYRLLGTSRAGGVNIYTIRMTPKSRLKPLFSGTITIAEGTYAVMGVDVTPNETFTIPFVKNIDLRYRQQFALYDSLFWMPTDIRINGGFNVSIVGLSLPRIGIEIISSIYDYGLNQPLADSLFHRPRVTVDSSAALFDSSFWRGNMVLPLAEGEQQAYRTLDSSQTLQKQFEPGGPLALMGGGGTDRLLNSVELRFNRVEGLFLGGDFHPERLSPYIVPRVEAGYALSAHRFEHRLGVTLFGSKEHRLGVGGDWYSTIEHFPDGDFYGPAAISLMALLLKNDYRDYYLAKGWRMFVAAAPGRRLDATLSFISETDYSLSRESDFSLFARSSEYRPNPPVREGRLRAVRLDLRLGPAAVPLDLVSRNALEISVERSSPRIAGSEFDFTEYAAVFNWSFTTFAGNLLFPPALRVRASGGLGLGALPPQRIFRIDSRASGYAPFGVLRGSDVGEFAGERFVIISAEQNFRSLPFLALNIPFLYRNGIELLCGGSIAQSWVHPAPTPGGWYAEAGAGISRILDLFRADVTYRLKDPRGWFFTFSVATLF
jgi:uncharacterized protein DUF5686/carboxypeptidase-like protein